MGEIAVLIRQEWRVGKKDHPADLLRKVLAASGDIGAPSIDFVASDTPVGGGVSATARALKKWPALAALAREITLPGAALTIPGLSTNSPEGRVAIEIEQLLSLLDGVPRSLPFHQISITLSWPVPEEAQLHLTDAWWINGRMRAMWMLWRGFADPASKAEPKPGSELAALLAALGKSKTTRLPLDPSAAAPPRELFEIVQRHRQLLALHVESLGLPHRIETGTIGEAPGPMKPALVAAFEPRGFDCRGGHGVFTLRRRTASNHVVEMSLDVGTWSHHFHGSLTVLTPGYRAMLPLLVAPGARGVAIAGAEGWKQIVENLELVVDDLERRFVPEIEAAAGVAPAWFEPL